MKPKKVCRVFLLFSLVLLFSVTVMAQSKVVVIPLDSENCDCDAISTVTSANQVWMDRNLGALRVATSSTDYHAYGYMFQWGRLADGHEARASDLTPTPSGGDDPGHDDFITTSSSPNDWLSSPNNNLWDGVSGTNNPCPAGFRLPTKAEWETEMATWDPQNAGGAFNSPLRLVVAGYREHDDGMVDDVGSHGRYWSSTVDGGNASALYFHGGTPGMTSLFRAKGFSVRCIKD